MQEFWNESATLLRRTHVLGIVALLASVLGACSSPRPTSTTVDNRVALQARITSLERRRTELEDINDIKRLQRAYGYYMDAGLWDEVADLFADDGTVEFALDGVYRGKQRVRQYFYALGGGKVGLAPGQISEHFQVMPVVDVAADGRSAKGTWRAVVLTGRESGDDAFWSEGPYENAYVKVSGVWKISALHWFQTLKVPYAGGWAKQRDVNGGKYVSNTLPPDSPPTIPYKTWPNGFVPPFHFMGKPPGPSLVAVPPRASASADEALASNDSLANRAAVLMHAVGLLEDQHQIENLQRIYGYYIDKDLWGQAAGLFADDAVLDVEGRGAYVGKDHVLAYLRAIGPEGPQDGRLFDNMQLQPVVHVNPDGMTAKARWHLFAQLAVSKKFDEWGAGVYENDYVKQGGVWKIRRLHLYPSMYAPYAQGWGKVIEGRSNFEPSLAPDRPAVASGMVSRIAPFDYRNPGKQLPVPMAESWRTSKKQTLEQTATQLLELDHRIGLLQDAAQIENLHAMYGYYLATFEWDALTDLFAPNGTIEIALRGVYVGKASVRRNLNLYGQQGLDDGVLHNHMQYQAVIDVADDRQTAKMRSRAFSMMGEFGKTGLWMGGVYENRFVKIDGVWRIQSDHVVNTYFMPYEVGWKELASRPAPGINAANPPDLPPSESFVMYPKAFLPPFHYLNPVTGQAADGP